MTELLIDSKAKTLIEGIAALDWNGTINTEDEQKSAANVLSSVKASAKDLKTKKEAITKPLNAALKEVRAQFKPAEERIEQIEKTIKGAMLAYHEIKESIAQEEIDRIESRVKPGKGNLSTESAMARLADVEQPKTDLGGAQIKYSAEKVRITDALLLVQNHPSILNSERVLEALRMEVAASIKAGSELPTGAELYREKLIAGIAG